MKLSGPSGATIADDTGARHDPERRHAAADLGRRRHPCGGNSGARRTSRSRSRSRTRAPGGDGRHIGHRTAPPRPPMRTTRLAPARHVHARARRSVRRTVTVKGDTIYEPDETFGTLLANPANATIADDTGVGTIQNDDAQPAISVRRRRAPEGRLRRRPTSTSRSRWRTRAPETVTVDYATQDGHHGRRTPTTTLAVGHPHIRPRTDLQDGDREGERRYGGSKADETFTLRLSGPAHATIADDAGLGTIQNDDCSYARPKAATPVSAPLVLAYEPCTAPTGPMASRCRAGPARARAGSPNLTVGTPDANGPRREFAGSVRLGVCAAPGLRRRRRGDRGEPHRRALPGRPSVPCAPPPTCRGGSDYTGELGADAACGSPTSKRRGRSGARTRDRAGPRLSAPHCARDRATLDRRECDLSTTANALLPGTVGGRGARDLGARSGRGLRRRSRRLRLDARGAAPFAVQGIFAP